MKEAVSQNPDPGIERLCKKREQFIAAPTSDGIERIEARFYGNMFSPHRHDTYALGITMHGVQTFNYRGAFRASNPGNVIILHPDELHDGGAGTEDGLQYRMLYIEPALLRCGLDHDSSPLPFVDDPVIRDPLLWATLASVLGELDSDVDPLLRDQFVADIAQRLSLHAKAPLKQSRFNASRNMDQVRAFLEDNFDRPVASGELEQVADMDRFRLIRHFRARFGTTPYRYLMMRRLQKARALIALGQPLAGIAAETGFADQSHFNRHFRQTYGLTPGRWAGLTGMETN
ncbi:MULTISPECIES: AraC family transcriptional regulator [Thalassospira]|uniref:AraC family transcriptional regulator n=2 Tax=Thalassospira TaxID=168934 RepID=A0A367WDJ6_9PROT|nr:MULTISPECIES: AraC family transcriptional regulator [Thalassospira]MDG4718532.1 AraC family transcriptional regulator [Thalassospira sp. FZY0004]RCK39524.1 AraC family transcriptional regulator [Thalassospira profundimaris]